jgi:hypothetical protein
MRAAIAVVVVLLSSCATDRLSVDPPPGVDFSGKWKLNEADSDDPLHLMQAQNSSSSKSQENNDGTGAGSGGGRSGRRGSRGAGGGPGTGYAGPPAPPLAAMSAPLRWPGKNVEVKQVAGVVAFTSDGRNRVCQPNSEKKAHVKPDPRDRDSLPAGRDALPFVCGWLESTLVVTGGDPDEDRPAYEEHYELSEDRKRLVETVVFKGGRSNGYTLSRVWDRVEP